MLDVMSVNGVEYTIIRLLGKGKGGYSGRASGEQQGKGRGSARRAESAVAEAAGAELLYPRTHYEGVSAAGSSEPCRNYGASGASARGAQKESQKISGKGTPYSAAVPFFLTKISSSGRYCSARCAAACLQGIWRDRARRSHSGAWSAG